MTEILLFLFCTLNLALLLVLLLRRPPLQEELRRNREELAESLRKELGQVRQEVVKHNLDHFSAVAEKLGDLHRATGQVVELSKGVQALHTILSKSQGRGAFGEWTLERMLADLFGEHTEMYETQFVVEEGERVDAAIFVKPDRSQFLAVDAKFPLAHAMPLLEGKGTPEIERAFAKDVKERAEEVASKYVKPPRTLDFAFMFVPSEAVYYLVLQNAKLHEELLRKRVIPTSPNSFHAYLQALAIAFRGMKIEQKTVEIQRAIVQVAKDFSKFMGDYLKVGEKLEQASKAYESTRQEADRFTKRIDKLQLGEVKEPATAPTRE